jgi:hypothetical protein
MGWRGIRYELGQALHTFYDAAGFLRAQPDAFGESAQVKAPETVHPLGFAARPPATSKNPDGSAKGGGGCKVRVGYDGNELHHTEFVGDQRDIANLPPIGEAGGSTQYAPGAAAPSFDKHDSEDGTKQIYVEIGDSAHLVTIGKDGNGDAIVEIVHADGMALTMLKESVVLKNKAGDVYLELKAGGGTLNGNWKVTGAFDVGSTSFPMVLFPPLATLVAALAGLASALASEPALLPATKTAAGALVTAIGAFLTAGPTKMTKGF